MKLQSILTAVLVCGSLITGSIPAAAETTGDTTVGTVVFSTDFDSYTVNGETTYTPFTGQLSSDVPYAGIYQVKPSTGTAVISAETKDEDHGTSMKMNGNWANVTLSVTGAETGVLLISLDYNVGNGANVRFLANNGSNFFTAFDGGGIMPEARTNSGGGDAFSFTQGIVKTNSWNNIKVYIDNDNKVFTLIANDVLIKKNVPFYGDQTGLKSLQVQHENGNDTYIDNLSVTKIEAMPVFNYSNFLFRTDFDCYTKNGVTASDAFTGTMPYADITKSGSGGTISAATQDEAHGTSMKLSGDWANLNMSVTGADTGIQLVSLDYYMPQNATVRFLANNGSNFWVAFTGTGIKPEYDDGTGYSYTADVVKTGLWNTVKVYVDNTNKIFTLIANDSLIAKDVPFYKNQTGLSTLLSTLQIQHKSGADVYIDNLSVRTLSVMPTFGSEPLFSTDFDSYTVKGVTVADEFTGGIPYAGLGYAHKNTGKASPVNKDEAHGTSMKLSGDWAMIEAFLNARFADIGSGIKVISFDYYMEADGKMKFIGNNAKNFQVYCTGNQIKCHETNEYKTGVIDTDKWNSVKIYVDNTEKLFAVYANDTVIVQNKTFTEVLASIQMQHESGSDVYIDNLKIEDFIDDAGYYHDEAFTFTTSNSINENSTVTVVVKTGNESATNILTLRDLTGNEITTVTGGGDVNFAVFIRNVPEGTSIESIRLN